MIEYSTAFWMVLIWSSITFGVGYYIGERGVAGVENDLANVKLDVAHLKGVASVPTTTVVTAAA